MCGFTDGINAPGALGARTCRVERWNFWDSRRVAALMRRSNMWSSWDLSPADHLILVGASPHPLSAASGQR